jgi:hypothetical protein
LVQLPSPTIELTNLLEPFVGSARIVQRHHYWRDPVLPPVLEPGSYILNREMRSGIHAAYRKLTDGLFQVRSQGVNQVVGRLSLLIGGCGLGIENMKADVSLDDLSHESVHGASASGDVMQHIGTFGLLIERPLDRVHLAPDSSYSIQQFFLFFLRVRHKKSSLGSLQVYPAGYILL